MTFISGDDIQRMLEGTMKVQLQCRQCQTSFTFEEGGLQARKNGIQDKVVQCPKCTTVFRVDVRPTGVTLLENVNDQYPNRKRVKVKKSKPVKAAPPVPTKADGWWKRFWYWSTKVKHDAYGNRYDAQGNLLPRKR